MQSYILAGSVFIGGITIPSPRLDRKIDFTLSLVMLAVFGVIALVRHLRDK